MFFDFLNLSGSVGDNQDNKPGDIRATSNSLLDLMDKPPAFGIANEGNPPVNAIKDFQDKNDLKRDDAKPAAPPTGLQKTAGREFAEAKSAPPSAQKTSPLGTVGDRDKDAGLIGPGQVGQDDETPIRPEAEREIGAATRSTEKRPTLRLWESREWAIRNDRDAHFNIAKNPKEKGDAPFYREHGKGAAAVRQHDAIIAREAKRQGVNPDLIRAIMYVENADGSRFGLSAAADKLGFSNTLFPMNIDPAIWRGIGGVKAGDFKKPESNIRAAAALVKAIRDRVDDPTPAKIGSIWNFTGREKVNGVGARIQRAFDERSWER